MHISSVVAAGIPFVLQALLALPSQADEQADLRAKYEAEAAPAWEAYRAEMAKFSGRSVIVEHDRTPNRRLHSETHLEWMRRDECLFFLGERRSETAIENEATVHAINSRYSFTMRRIGLAGKWLATEVDAGRGKREAQLKRDLDTFSLNPVSIAVVWRKFDDIAAREEYKIKSLTREAKGDESLIRVEFDYEPKEVAFPTASGWVTYDPEHFWVVRELNVEMRSTPPAAKKITSTSAAFTYDFDMVKMPLVRKIEMVRKWPAGAYDREVTQTFEWDEAVPDEAEFMLGAFGIEEPEEVRPP